jgi:hypothetical protein
MPKLTTITDPKHFEDWIAKANSGDRCIYYTGYLYVDRCWASSTLKGEMVLAARGRVAAANRAWKSYNEGYVALTQKKLGDMEYQYIATRIA